jgi:hypothetical protein
MGIARDEHPAARIFCSLEGSWSLKRTISNFGKIDGTATFTNCTHDSGVLRYREEGVLFSDNGQTHVLFREYYYQLSGQQIVVFFDQPRAHLFHTLSFATSVPITATASHVCKQDRYDAAYSFVLPLKWSLAYTVSGPEKNYAIKTAFQRMT